MTIDDVGPASQPEHHSDELRLDVVERHHLDLWKEHGHDRLSAGATSPDLGYDASGRDQACALPDETGQEPHREPIASFERQEGAGIEHDAGR